MIGAFIGLGMWLLASAVYGSRMPYWYLVLLMTVMMVVANV